MSGPFTIYLPSNSPSFPNNTSSKYRVKLAQTLRFEGKWLCGVEVIYYTHSWNIFDKDEFFFIYLSNGEVVKCMCPKTDFIQIQDFEEAVNIAIKMGIDDHYGIRRKRAVLRTPKKVEEVVKDNRANRIYPAVFVEKFNVKQPEKEIENKIVVSETSRFPNFADGQVLPIDPVTDNPDLKTFSYDDVADYIENDKLRELARRSVIIQDKTGNFLVFPENFGPFAVSVLDENEMTVLEPEKLVAGKIVVDNNRKHPGFFEWGEHWSAIDKVVVNEKYKYDTVLMDKLKNGNLYELKDGVVLVFPKKEQNFYPIFVKDGEIISSANDEWWSLMSKIPIVEVTGRRNRNPDINIHESSERHYDYLDENDARRMGWRDHPPEEIFQTPGVRNPELPQPPVINEENEKTTEEVKEKVFEIRGEYPEKPFLYAPATAEDIITENEPGYESFDVIEDLEERPAKRTKIVEEVYSEKIEEAPSVSEEKAPIEKPIPLNQVTIEYLKEKTGFVFKKHTSRFTFVAPKDWVKYVVLPQKFGYMLGYDPDEKVRPYATAKYMPDIRAGIHRFYVYENSGLTDLVMVGDKMTSMLQVVNIESVPGENKRVPYDKIMYKRVMLKEVSDIEIEVKTATGEYVPFNYGEFMVVLHFKPAYI